MGSQDNVFWFMFFNVFDGWQSSNNSLVVGDSLTVQWDVEVNSDKDSLSATSKSLTDNLLDNDILIVILLQ